MGKIKLLVNMDTPIEIESSSKDLSPLHERITMVFHPFETSNENLTKFPDISRPDATGTFTGDTDWVTSTFAYNYPPTAATKTAWSFIPTASQFEMFEGIYKFQNSTNGYIKVEIPTNYSANNYEKVLRFTERIEFIYEAANTHQQLKRKNVPSKNTQNMGKSLDGCMKDGANNDISTTYTQPTTIKISIFPPEILSAVVTHETPNNISYKLTDKRTLTFINNTNDVTSNVTTMLVDNFLKEKENIDEYEDLPDFEIGGNVISFTPSTNTLVVQREAGKGKLTQDSVIEPKVEFDNNSSVRDEYNFRLIRSPNFTFDNQIVNPVLVGIASPYDAINRDIILKIKKGLDATSYISLDPTAALQGSLNRNSGVTGDIIEDNINISVTNTDYHQSSTLDHLMDNTNQLTITSHGTTSSPHNGVDIMKLTLNRYPRYGLNYQINYSQDTRTDQGIYDEYDHAVLKSTTFPVINDMQNIVVKSKSTFNVIYPASKPTSFAGTAGALTPSNNNYEDYPVYYEASVTFKNSDDFDNDVNLSARYNYETPPGTGGEYELQRRGGHNLKHGTILYYGSDVVNENTLQTTIRNGNTVVDLTNSSNYGEKLVIQFIPGDGSKFAFDDGTTSGTETPTFYFKDTSITPSVHFKDKEKLNLNDSGTGNHYFTNLITDDGNVVPPFEVVFNYDNHYTQDSNGNSPEINGSPVLKATYTAPAAPNPAFWTKTVELNFHQDIYDSIAGVGVTINKGASTFLFNRSLTGDKITLTMTNLDDVTSHDISDNKISAVYTNPTFGSGGSYPFTNKLYNWFGFEIASFNSLLVNDSSLETLPTIAFGNILGTLSDFSVADNQLFENNYSGNLAWHVSNHASFPNGEGHRFKYYIQISEEDSATGSFSTWQNFPPTGTSFGGTANYELSTTITGLNYDKYYKFRVRGKSYDYGEWTVISDIHSIETITPYAASNKNVTPSAPIAKFEWTTPDTDIDTYRIQITKKFYASGEPDFTDLSGTILLTGQSGSTTNFSFNADNFTISAGVFGYFNPDDTFQTRILGTKDSSSPYTGFHWVSQDDAVTIHDASSNILSFRAHKDDRLYNAIDISFTHVNDIDDYIVNFYTKNLVSGTYTKIGSRDFTQTGPTQHDDIDDGFSIVGSTGTVLDKLENANGLASGGDIIYATIESKFSVITTAGTFDRTWEEPEFDTTTNNFGTITPDFTTLLGTTAGDGVNYSTSPTLSIVYGTGINIGIPENIAVTLKDISDADIFEISIANNSSYNNSTGGFAGSDRSNTFTETSLTFNATNWSTPSSTPPDISLNYNTLYYGKYRAGDSGLGTAAQFSTFGSLTSADSKLLSKPGTPGGTGFSFSATIDNVNDANQYNDVTVQFDESNDSINPNKTLYNFKYVLEYGETAAGKPVTEVELTGADKTGSIYSYQITNLDDNTTYFFRIFARNNTSGLTGTFYGGGDSEPVTSVIRNIGGKPITASIDSWKIYEKESATSYIELNKSVAIIDEYVRMAFSTDISLNTISVTKVEAIETTTQQLNTATTPNTLAEIIETSIDSDIKGGYIQLKINAFNKDGYVKFHFDLTSTTGVTASYTADSNGVISIDSSRPDVDTTTEAWEVKIWDGSKWVTKTTTNGIGTDTKKAYSGEMLELSFNTEDDDLSGNSIPEGIYDISINLTENPDEATPIYVLAASSTINSSNIDISYNTAKNGGKIGYIVQDGDFGTAQFQFNLRDENGNIIATKEDIKSYITATNYFGANNIDYPNDNNITFDITLNLGTGATAYDGGDVDFILDYDPPKPTATTALSFRERATVTDISFCSADDVSFNSLLDTYIINSNDTDYVLYAPQTSSSTNVSVFDANGDFNKTSYDAAQGTGATGYFYTKNSYPDGVGGTTYDYGIGRGDKFVEASLFWYKDGVINNYRKIFEKTGAEAFTLPLNGTATTSKKFSMVRADFPARTSQRNSASYSNIKNDPYVLKLNNFKQKVNGTNEPIKQFVDDISGALTVITGEYKYPDYLWGSRALGTIDFNTYSGTTTQPCVAFGGTWPKRRWDVSKNILEQDITGFVIRAHDSGAPGDTFLTFNNALTGLNRYIIPTTSTAAATSSVLKTPYTSSNPTSFKLDHIYRMDEMEGTTSAGSLYGISGEKIDWQIAAISNHTTNFVSNEAQLSGNSYWSHQTPNALNPGDLDYTTGDKVKQGFIPRTPYYSDNLTDVEIGDNNGGSDIVVTGNDYFPGVMDSSGNVDISFNYWEEGKQLFYPHKEADISSPSESNYWFNTTFKFQTDISGATFPFTTGTTGDYRTFDISWNINKQGNYNSVETNDISFNLADLSNNSYYEYKYDIVNTLCATDADGARFPELTGDYSCFLANPNRPNVYNWTTGNFTTDTLGSIDVAISNKKGVTDLGGGIGTRTQDMLVEAEWVIRNLTIVDGSLNRFSANHLGSTNNEAFGYSVAMSGDAHTLAVGAPYYTNDDGAPTGRRECGRVVVFKWRNKRWEKLSNELIGNNNIGSNEYDHFGFSIALSKNGNVLVVGAPQDISKDSNDTGYVRIYGYKENLNNYELLSPTNIYGPTGTGTNWDNHEKFGFCVDITPDGKHVIAGTPNANTSSSDPKGQGVIRYYKLVSDADGGGYEEISGSSAPSNINLGASDFSSSSDPSGVQFSFSNAISNDGKLIAAGAPYWRSASDNYGTSTGKVELLRWDPSTPEWTTDKVGVILAASTGGSTSGNKLTEIKGTNVTSFIDILQGDSVADSSNNEFGYSVDFANNRLIVGAPAKDNSGNNTNDEGAIYIYSCDDSVAIGTANENKGLYPIELISVKNINGSNTDNLRFGSAVSISEDGKSFAVGAPRKGTSGDTEDHGMVQVFTLPEPETIIYDLDEMGASGSGDIGIALTGGTLVRLDTMAEEERPKLIVGNKYIFNIGSGLYDTEDVALGYKDNASGNVLEYSIGVTTTPLGGTGSNAGHAIQLELDLRDGYAIHSKKLVELFLYNSNSTVTSDYDTHLNVGLIESIQLGNDISGNALSDDYFGSSVKLSSDGKEVIIGGHQSFETTTDIEKGYAKIYKYSTYTEKWENISGPFVDVSANSDISNNGTIDDYYVSHDSVNEVLKYGLVSAEEGALEPFSRNNLPVYNSNFKIRVANKNRKVENSKWQYGPGVTVKISNTENQQFDQNGIDWEVKHDNSLGIDFIEARVRTENLLGKMYVTSPEPSNFSGILDQFTLDVSYNTWDNSQNITTNPVTGTPWANTWQDVSSNVNPNEYSINGAYQDSLGNWVVDELWDISSTQLDYGNIVLRWPVLTYNGATSVVIDENNMWRWQLRLSYTKDTLDSSNNITSGFERLTNGEFRYNVGSYKSILQDFSQETASPVFGRVTSYSNEYDNTLNLINVGYSTQIKSGIDDGEERGPPISLYQTDYNSPIQNEELIPWGHKAHFILWYPSKVTGCIRGATNNTNNSNKTNVANKPNLNVSSDMEIENRFARVDRDEIRELTISGTDTCIQKIPHGGIEEGVNMMDLGRGFTCFVHTSANWLQSDFDTLQLNNNYGTLLENTIVSDHGVSLANPTNIFKWKPDFSEFLPDPTTLPFNSFKTLFIKDASANYYDTSSGGTLPPAIGSRSSALSGSDSNYSPSPFKITITDINSGTGTTGESFIRIELIYTGYKLNPLDGYNTTDFNKFLKLIHRNNSSGSDVVVSGKADWITSSLPSGVTGSGQSLDFTNTETGGGTYNGLHSQYKITHHIQLADRNTYSWSTNDFIEIQLQDPANGTYNMKNKMLIEFT